MPDEPRAPNFWRVRVGARIRSGEYTGTVSEVRRSTFDVLFSWPEPMTVMTHLTGGRSMPVTHTHFKRRFRKMDGRSMGGKQYHWAEVILEN